MKKIISLVLILVMCLSLCACGKNGACSCDCAQCAQCEKKTQATEIADTSHMEDVPEVTELSNDVIEFETPIVVAEDQNIRVELVKFYQEYTSWTNAGRPSSIKADSTTEGATLEKYVVFKFCNKTDHTLLTYMDDIYLGSDGAYNMNAHSSKDIAAGKNISREFIIQTGEKETLKSIEELYSLDGDFYVSHKGEDGISKNGYTLKFSIPNGMNGDSTDSASLENSSYLGKWQVTDITFADENISSHMKEDPELWENYFKGVLSAFDNVYFVLTESGDFYYHSNTSTNTGKWKETGTDVKVGGMVLVAEGNKLVSEQDGYLLFWEKVSDSQEVPEA